ncbi:PepSY domain-containing protein [Nocardia sp. NPDC052254]|uniref:PepSY domain-containing protein n=1 Tax=Nocardia sp. NPDC052254 TaxID=3155681 RepID=UPI00341B4304
MTDIPATGAEPPPDKAPPRAAHESPPQAQPSESHSKSTDTEPDSPGGTGRDVTPRTTPDGASPGRPGAPGDAPANASAASAVTERPGTHGPARALQALALRLHFYAGVFVAPFILIAAVTGALYAIAPTMESVVNRDLLHVDSSGPARPLSEQIAAAVGGAPESALAAVDPAQHPGDTTRVLFSDPGLGASEQRAVFVDPATAKPVGDSVVYGSTGALPLRTWIDVLHRNLHLGETGRLYSEMAASWMWVIALAGIVLWVRRSRGSLRHMVRPQRGRTARGRGMSRHAALGTWILLPLLFLSATGLTWSAHAGDHITALRQQLSWTTPVVATALPGSTGPSMPAGSEHDHHGGGAGMSMPVSADRAAQVDKVFAVARGHGVDGPVEISIPAGDHTAFVVKERRLSGVYTQDSISVDGRTGDVVDILRYADWPLMAKLANWGIQLHMGMLFGLANQILLLATMIALIVVIGYGYRMWWQRRPIRAERRLPLGRAPVRGVLRRTPPWIVAALAVVTVAVGWFAPVLGIGLLAFLIIDLFVGFVTRRREGAVA